MKRLKSYNFPTIFKAIGLMGSRKRLFLFLVFAFCAIEIAGSVLYSTGVRGAINSLSGNDRGEVEHVLPVQFQAPDVKTEDLSVSSGTRIGGLFETRLPRATETDKNRAHNVDLAIRALDGLTIPPGASFSFNEATGPRTAEAGYVDAPVYADGRITMGLGGGICQLSTTACNAMLEAGLEPLERHAHMFMVGYTSPGRDASVAYGIQDRSYAKLRLSVAPYAYIQF